MQYDLQHQLDHGNGDTINNGVSSSLENVNGFRKQRVPNIGSASKV